jgi:hypothetical protein
MRRIEDDPREWNHFVRPRPWDEIRLKLRTFALFLPE